MSFCSDCVKGVIHDGTPQGKIEAIGGVKCYVATPTGEYARDTVVLFLPDVFGLEFVNSQLLADGFAANGFWTVIPDYLNGDPVNPDEALAPGANYDIMKWFANDHGTEHTRPPLDAVIAALKAQGVQTFGATGYCFGGRYCLDLAFENVTKAIVISHPALLKAPEDFQTLKAKSKNPFLLNTCEIDQRFPPEQQQLADDVLGDGQYTPGYVREHWAGCTHGFANRGDVSIPLVKAGKEGAFNAAVKFFKEHL